LLVVVALKPDRFIESGPRLQIFCFDASLYANSNPLRSKRSGCRADVLAQDR